MHLRKSILKPSLPRSASVCSDCRQHWLRSLIGSHYRNIEIRWREVLTGKALDLWFTNNAYWHLTQGECSRDVDNPDQRIADDCKLFLCAVF